MVENTAVLLIANRPVETRESKYSGPWWLSPRGGGADGECDVPAGTEHEKPVGFEGGTSPLPCLHVGMNACNPHPTRPPASSSAPSVLMLRPYSPSHPAPGAGAVRGDKRRSGRNDCPQDRSLRSHQASRNGAGAPKVRCPVEIPYMGFIISRNVKQGARELEKHK
jgi:hypothetical protein